jgi:hypothetical protein
MLALFDFPDPNIHADRRVETTTPLQKLFVMNSPLVVHHALALARRLATEIPSSVEQADRRRIERAYRLLFARSADEAEIRLGLDFLGDQERAAARWPQYAHVLLASNELLFVD